MLEWVQLTALSDLDEVDQLSRQQPVVILKHSTRCSISSMALGRLQRNYTEVPATFYYLDLLKYRDISNAITERYSVHHESPQVLLIQNGECVYEASHMDISFEEIASEISENS